MAGAIAAFTEKCEMKRVACGLAAIMAAVTTDALAADSPLDHAATALGERLYVSPVAAYTWADSKRSAQDEFGWGIALGRQINSTVSFELSYFTTDFGEQAALGGEKTDAYGADLLVFPIRRLPDLYGIVAGHYGDSGGRSEDSSIVYDAGAGYLIGPFRFLNYGSLRGEVRVRFTNLDETVDNRESNHRFLDYVVNVGVLFPLGSAPKPVPPPRRMDESEPEPEPEPVAVVPPLPEPIDELGNGIK